MRVQGDGIADSRAEYGDSKNWAAQVGARRNELTLRALELGMDAIGIVDRNTLAANPDYPAALVAFTRNKSVVPVLTANSVPLVLRVVVVSLYLVLPTVLV